MVKLTVRKVGNSLGLILPAEAVKALRVKEGDALYLTETPKATKSWSTTLISKRR